MSADVDGSDPPMDDLNTHAFQPIDKKRRKKEKNPFFFRIAVHVFQRQLVLPTATFNNQPKENQPTKPQNRPDETFY